MRTVSTGQRVKPVSNHILYRCPVRITAWWHVHSEGLLPAASLLRLIGQRSDSSHICTVSPPAVSTVSVLWREEGYSIQLRYTGEQYWFSVLFWQPRLYFPVHSQLYWGCTGKYTPSSTGSIFSSTLPVEVDLYGKILPSNTGEFQSKYNIV